MMNIAIIRDNNFDDQVRLITKTYPRMDELDSAIDWLLSRDPKQVSNLYNVTNDIYLWVTGEFSVMGIPRVRILFRYLENQKVVHLLEIESVDEDKFV